MPLRRLKLQDFSAFRLTDIEFVEGMNVFVGANGTGKTHVLKVMYALVDVARSGAALAPKLAGVFKPEADQIGRLARRVHGLSTAKVTLHGDTSASTSFELHTKGKLKHSIRAWKEGAPAVFLPSREILAMYEGFIAAYKERELSFDETYYDACIRLNANPIKGSRKLHAEQILSMLQSALGGHVELSGPRFYVKFSGDKARMEAHLVAEGLRKIASLERLLLNGSLTKNGFLFWDEPEANLNPRLTVVMADVLGVLASMGIQIFVTTHDFLLARRLSVKAAMPGQPPTRFFAFNRASVGAPVEIHYGAQLADLPTNPMEEEFARHYDFELASIGVGGTGGSGSQPAISTSDTEDRP
jgi:ABC-type transport system involved in cytochrome c biogenesis ATPase subunit